MTINRLIDNPSSIGTPTNQARYRPKQVPSYRARLQFSSGATVCKFVDISKRTNKKMRKQ